jgi:hypothetical protein
VIVGLPDSTIAELRARFPRVSIADLISRIAAFPRECFASAAYLASQIGKSPRTVFRYFRTMKDEGVIVRHRGDRDRLPQDATQPLPLRAHGYALTQFQGWLAPMVAQGRALIRDRYGAKRKKQREAKEAKRRQKRMEAERAHAEFEAQYPELAKRYKAAPKARDASKASPRPSVTPSHASQVAPEPPQGSLAEPVSTGPPD